MDHNSQTKIEEGQKKNSYSCELCQDIGYIIIPQERMQPTMKPCKCLAMRKVNSLWKASGITPDDLDKSFANFDI